MVMKHLIFFLLLTTASTGIAHPMTATDIRNAFIEDQKTAAEVKDDALRKIRNRDIDHNAVIVAGGAVVDESAAQLDRLTTEERRELPLAGVPVLVKDNVEVKGWPTTAGSLALAGNDTQQDAELIKQLRDAGALILGKANLSEWANFRSETSNSGWSGVGGQTRNAHDSSRSPCGSSSGSAVAVALGYVPVAIGSETDGSIVCPASINGVVGFKPTHGLVSGHGIVPLAASQDTAGPITNSVDDAVTALAAMIDMQSTNAADVTQALQALPERKDLKNVNVGVIALTRGFDRRRDALLDQAIAVLQSLGASIVEGIELQPYSGFNGDEYDVLLYEFKAQLNAYLANLPGPEKELTLEKLIAFNEASEVELSLFDQSIFEKAHALPISESDYEEKLKKIKTAAREDGLDKVLADHEIDVLVGVTVGPAWTIDHVNGDAFHGPSVSSLPAVGGHPHLTVPMGNIRGLPIGLSFIAGRYEDAKVADIARLYEKNRQM